jgi:hypothetical protein
MRPVRYRPVLEGLEDRLVPSANVLTYHNDGFNDGQNVSETILTPTNVNSTDFGKQFAIGLDGAVVGQPLYMSNLNITAPSSPGVQNVVFVATTNDSVYAFNADNGTQLWKASLLTKFHGAGDTVSASSGNGVPIQDTPSIDPTSNVLYVESEESDNGNWVHMLSALNLADGSRFANTVNIAEGNPVYLSGPAVNKIGGGQTLFDSRDQTCRTMTLDTVNGVVYMAYGDPGDTGPYNGWIIGYSAAKDASNNLTLKAVFCATPNGSEAGIWQAGGAISVDGAGNLYVETGNGTFETFANTVTSGTATLSSSPFTINVTTTTGFGGSGTIVVQTAANGLQQVSYTGTTSTSFTGCTSTATGSLNTNAAIQQGTLATSRLSHDTNFLVVPAKGDYGDTVLKLTADSDNTQQSDNPNGFGLHVADYFTPKDEQSISNGDVDLGSSSPLLLPNSAGSTAHSQLLVALDKQGIIYLIDRNNMGGYHGDLAGDGSTGPGGVTYFNGMVQAINNAIPGGNWDSAAFFNNGTSQLIYIVGSQSGGNVGKTFAIANAAINTTPTSTGTHTYGYPGSTPEISANGTANGIVWTLDKGANALIADDAANFNTQLFISNTGSNGLSGSIQTFNTPMVANGHVYVGTGNDLNVYGLLLKSITVTPANPSVIQGNTQQFTATGTYQDNSTADLTKIVGWSSSNTSAATITSGATGGLATAVAPPTSTITATYNGTTAGVTVAYGPITGSTLMTVTTTSPTVTAVSPNADLPAGNTSITITGTNFTGATAVKFGSTNAVSFVVNSATSITATDPAGTAGNTVDVTVTTPAGTSATSNADKFTYETAPTVTLVNPNAGVPGGGTSVAITGTNFTTATAVKFGATNATSFTVNSATSITAVDPVGTAGTTVDVTVTTPVGTSATGTADKFTYEAAPTVTLVSPNAGVPGGGTSVTITGTNFTAATTVKFGTINATSFTVNSATSITAVDPAGTAGSTVDVTVTTPVGTSATSNAGKFTYETAPTVTQVSPNAGVPGGGTSVTITGTNFTAATAVKFGGTNATSFTVNSATSITAVDPVGTAGTTVDVTVTTPLGTSAASNADRFTYEAAPTVTQVSPKAGLPGGGQTITINGTNFTAATGVKFGTTAASNVMVVSATQITATAPAEAAGTVDVTVTTPVGTSATSTADQFTYEGAPTVTAISPAAGLPAGGQTITITGTNFTAATGVKFGTTAGINVIVVSATQITATDPVGTAGTTVDVSVTTPVGTSSTSPADQFTYETAPTVTAVSPNSGLISGGQTIIITGSNFIGASAVKFGNVAATSFTVNSATQITAIDPPGNAGSVDVTVATPIGTSATSPADRFTYIPIDNIGVFRASTGTWYLDEVQSSYNPATTLAVSFGSPGDMAVTGDWLGTGQKYIGVFRPSTGTWFLSTTNTGYTAANTIQFGFGGNGDVPVIGRWGSSPNVDYVGVFRPSTGQWFLDEVQGSYSAATTIQINDFGSNGDMPVVGNWGKSSISDARTYAGVFRPSTGQWFLDEVEGDYNAATTLQINNFGMGGDTPVVGNWLGGAQDGHAYVGVFRQSTAQWFLSTTNSSYTAANTLSIGNFGESVDIARVGDWLGTGFTDVGVFRPGTGNWFLSTTNTSYTAGNTIAIGNFGMIGDQPVVGAWAIPGPELLQGQPGNSTDSLSDAELQTIVSAAISRWESAGLDGAGVAVLESLHISIGDLPPGWLGAYVSGSIVLDPTADGDGWFVDATDAAFAQGSPETALPGSAAASHVDALTVVMHEMGHALGLPDESSGVMSESLVPGTRNLPTAADVAAAFASGRM